jgi:N-ethylmaleimide reductase
MTEEEIHRCIEAFAQGARNARDAGLDGVELHGANGYLLEQFFHPATNQRTDDWGGNFVGRGRFLLSIAKACAQAIGAGRVGLRLSPHGVFNDMAPYDGVEEAYSWMARELSALGLAYLHIVDHSAIGAPPVPDSTKAAIRAAFKGSLILSGGYDRARAEADLAANKGELVAFGRPFLANPDLVARLQQNAALNVPDAARFYTPGAGGYTDYPGL